MRAPLLLHANSRALARSSANIERGQKRLNDWHPVIREIVANMSRDAWEPELETQLAAAERVAALKKSEREKVTRELGALATKLATAGQPAAARHSHQHCGAG